MFRPTHSNAAHLHPFQVNLLLHPVSHISPSSLGRGVQKAWNDVRNASKSLRQQASLRCYKGIHISRNQWSNQLKSSEQQQPQLTQHAKLPGCNWVSQRSLFFTMAELRHAPSSAEQVQRTTAQPFLSAILQTKIDRHLVQYRLEVEDGPEILPAMNSPQDPRKHDHIQYWSRIVMWRASLQARHPEKLTKKVTQK